jgi:pyroglutamyl-peptidase
MEGPQAAGDRGRLIVTGFEPFGGRLVNRSWEVLQRVEGPAGLERVQLPVDFDRLAALVPGLLAGKPRALLMVGESGTQDIQVETIARNIINPSDHVTLRKRPDYRCVCADGPAAYEARWDAAAIIGAIEGAGVRVSISHHAGTYACNAALYHALHTAAITQALTRIGFLHIPAN